MDELEDAKETPEELASNFTCAMFVTPQEVLKGARHMVWVNSFEFIIIFIIACLIISS